jgi:hypothetical protein
MPEMAGETTRRGYGHQHQRTRKVVLLRDPVCTERGCTRRSVEAHHDPALSERHPPGSDRYNVELMRGVCGPCHDRLTGQLQSRRLKRQHAARVDDEETFPAPAPVSINRRQLPRAWEGAVRVPLDGPVEVHRVDGTVTFVPAGQHYEPGDY